MAKSRKNYVYWASAIRKPQNGMVIGIFDIFRGDIPRSEIKANYPILFGVKANAKELITTIPLTHKVEQCSLKSITTEMFSHIEII